MTGPARDPRAAAPEAPPDAPPEPAWADTVHASAGRILLGDPVLMFRWRGEEARWLWEGPDGLPVSPAVIRCPRVAPVTWIIPSGTVRVAHPTSDTLVLARLVAEEPAPQVLAAPPAAPSAAGTLQVASGRLYLLRPAPLDPADRWAWRDGLSLDALAAVEVQLRFPNGRYACVSDRVPVAAGVVHRLVLRPVAPSPVT